MSGAVNIDESGVETRPSPGNRNAPRHGCVLLCLFVAAVAVAADPPQRTFNLAISRGAVPKEQRVLRVDKGDLVRILLTTDTPGVVHIHGYRLETKVTPGSASNFRFTARATGRYRIEWHPADEAASKGDHHGPPLAT
ncbi:MAG: hypothetical protein ACREUP_04885, partial [Burkholderiales bacterium]